jgi:hypothetical protein
MKRLFFALFTLTAAGLIQSKAAFHRSTCVGTYWGSEGGGEGTKGSGGAVCRHLGLR